MNRSIICVTILWAVLFYSPASFGQSADVNADVTATSSMSGTAKEHEEEIEILKRQLAAQSAINDQLRRRVVALEKQLLSDSKSQSPLVVGLDASLPKPRIEASDADSNSAIERALQTRGLTLLPVGEFRLTPSFSWVHSGSGNQRADSYVFGLGGEVGLPWGMSASASVPYISNNQSIGSNRGVGDFSFSMSKKLNNETENLPSFVARATYTDNSGKDPFVIPGVGSGFRSYSLALSAVKRFEPLVAYGSVSYGHSLSNFAVIRYQNGEELFRGQIAPGDTYQGSMGLSLAATPGVSLDVGVSYASSGKTRFVPDAGLAYESLRATSGILNLGAGFVLTRNLFLSVGVAAGITKDAPDSIFSISMPYRF